MPVKINSSGGGSVTLSSGSIATDVTATFPATTGNAVVDTAVQTLTNKTLTSPTITGAVVSSMASSVLTLGTAQASTSGVNIDFTGIPSWVRRVTVMFNGVSTNGSALIQIQLGSSAGFVTSGYAGGVTYSTVNGTNSTGFLIDYTGGPLATVVRTGAVSITNFTGNTWVSFGSISWNANTTVNSGSVALAGALDRVRLPTVGGTDTIDAGSINLLWE